MPGVGRFVTVVSPRCAGMPRTKHGLACGMHRSDHCHYLDVMLGILTETGLTSPTAEQGHTENQQQGHTENQLQLDAISSLSRRNVLNTDASQITELKLYMLYRCQSMLYLLLNRYQSASGISISIGIGTNFHYWYQYSLNLGIGTCECMIYTC